MKKLFTLLFLIAFIFVTKPVEAVYFGSGEKLTFPKTQKFNETVFVAASDLNFEADVTGDLLCAGQNITVSGKISGDVLCAGQNITITGAVDGNVRVVGQQVNLNGSVSRNLSVAAQVLKLSSSSNIKGDIYYGVQSVDLQGTLGRDLAGGSETINISGSLLRNAKIAANKINIDTNAKLGGDLEYFIEKTGTANLNEKSIKGKVTRHEVELKEKDQINSGIKKATPAILVTKTVLSIISSILLACMLLYFVPARVTQVTMVQKSHPVKSAFVGLAVLVTTPIAIIISSISVVGLGLAVVILFFYIISLILASRFVSISIGGMLIEKLTGSNKSNYLSAAFGCLVFGLVSIIPVVGPIVSFLVFLIGLGSTFLSYLPSEK